jgi:hypothetical protein
VASSPAYRSATGSRSPKRATAASRNSGGGASRPSTTSGADAGRVDARSGSTTDVRVPGARRCAGSARHPRTRSPPRPVR